MVVEEAVWERERERENVESDYKFSRKCRFKRDDGGMVVCSLSAMCAMHPSTQLFYVPKTQSLHFIVSLSCMDILHSMHLHLYPWNENANIQKWIHNFSSTCQTLSLLLLVLLLLLKIQHHVNVKMVQFWNIKCGFGAHPYARDTFLLGING